MGFKIETNGTGKTRRDPRAVYKAKSKVLRRVFDKTECLEGKAEDEVEQLGRWEDLDGPEDHEASYGDPDSGECGCFSCDPGAGHCCEDCAPCTLKN